MRHHRRVPCVLLCLLIPAGYVAGRPAQQLRAQQPEVLDTSGIQLEVGFSSNGTAMIVFAAEAPADDTLKIVKVEHGWKSPVNNNPAYQDLLERTYATPSTFTPSVTSMRESIAVAPPGAGGMNWEYWVKVTVTPHAGGTLTPEKTKVTRWW